MRQGVCDLQADYLMREILHSGPLKHFCTFKKETTEYVLKMPYDSFRSLLRYLTSSPWSSADVPYCYQKIIHKYSLMERNNCVGVISYKELEIAMQKEIGS